MCVKFELQKGKKYIPHIKDPEEKLRNMLTARAVHIYGEIPPAVSERLDWEISALKRTGNLNLMLIMGEIINSNELRDHPITGRGGLEVSLIAYLLGLSHTDPIDFDLHRELLFGSEGDKIHHISLNTSSAAKQLIITAMEERPEIKMVWPVPRKQERSGSRQTSSHLVIIPSDVEISDEELGALAMPFQELEDDDIFYHLFIYNDPMADCISVLNRLTHTHPENITFDRDEATKFFLSAASNGDELFFNEKQREIICEARPETYEDITKCLALAYNRVWDTTAGRLIREGIAKISELPATQEDVYEAFMSCGLDSKTSLRLKSTVCSINDFSPEDRELISRRGIPRWMIDFLDNVLYLFPRSHILELMWLNWQLGWYSLHHPEEYALVRCGQQIISARHKKLRMMRL